MPPQHDTRHTGDVIIGLARALGGPVAEALPWPNYSSLLKAQARGLFQAHRGSIMEEAVEDSMRSVLLRQGFWIRRHRNYEEFWQDLVAAGGWWDWAYFYRDYPRVFRTTSGRYEFYSLELKRRLESVAGKGKAEELLERLGLRARGDRAFLPHFEEPKTVGDPKSYPFHLVTYKLMNHAGGRGANQPWLQEPISVHLRELWNGWVEINPETAHRLGIKDGEEVWVESPPGRIRLRARLYPGVGPDVVAVPFEHGHTHYGRWAAKRGQNVNNLIGRLPPSLAATLPVGAVRVRLKKA
jgi:anaerobic selenocysteine-containing dehydrogenase